MAGRSLTRIAAWNAAGGSARRPASAETSIADAEPFRQLIEAAPVAVLVSRRRRCVFANDAALALFAADGETALVARDLHELVGEVACSTLMQRLAEPQRGRRPLAPPLEVVLKRLDGHEIVVDIGVAAVGEPDDPLVQLVLVDVTARQRAEAAMRHIAHHDPLTGLPNRVLLMDRLAQGIATTRRSRTRLALLVIDLDGFKEVNDTLGHAAGDTLLRLMAERIRSVVRDTDTLARLGGDEFAVIQSGLPDERVATTLTARILDAFTRPFGVGDQEVRVGVSIGVALYPDDAINPSTLLQFADMALYRAKDGGRNRFCFYESGMNAAAMVRRRVGQELEHAAGRDQLSVLFQPLVALADGRVVGAEALLRWHHPGFGEMSPADFIPIAESTGLIRQVGLWVLDRACAEIAAWAGCGIDLPVSVNVSVAQLRDARFAATVMAALQRHGVSPAALCLEITESLLVDPHLDGIGHMLEQLARHGVRIAIDDFGTGYSSLINLKRLPVHTIKIDRSFTRGIGRDPESEAIVEATVGLGRSLGKVVVAEGVETAEQHAFLERRRCDLGQGFLYSRPIAAAALRTLATRGA